MSKKSEKVKLSPPRGSTTKTKKQVEWGTAEYLQSRFDDIDAAWELSRKTVAASAFRAGLAKLATVKDGLNCGKVFEATCVGPDGKEFAGRCYFATVRYGLNGGGKQTDYFDAMRRLAKAGCQIIEHRIDILDDVGSLLVSFDRQKFVTKEGK